MPEVTPQPNPAPALGPQGTVDVKNLTVEQLYALAPEDVRTKDFEGIWKNAPKDIPGLLKTYAHAQRSQGGMAKIPGEGAKPEEVSAFWGKVGVPASVDGYGKLERPEWMPESMWDEGFTKRFLETAHKHNIPVSAAKALASFYQAEVQTELGKADGYGQEARDALTKLWGGAAERNAQRAYRAAQHLAGEEGKSLFDNPIYGDNPVLVKMFYDVSKLLEEAGAIDMNVENIPTVKQASSEALRVINDSTHPLHKAYHDLTHQDHDRTVKEVEKMFQLANL